MTRLSAAVRSFAAAVVGTAALHGRAARPGVDSPTRAPAPDMGAARVEVYKRVGDLDLNAYIFDPPGHTTNRPRPAIVFFFGGGWRSGTPAQFRPQAERLASRGMVAICADYRVASRHGVVAKDCVEDAKSAIRWVRVHAARLGVDSNRVVAAGGSAGGHLAACAGIVPGLEAQGEDLSVSSVPNAMVLFNPALVLAPLPGFGDVPESRLAELRERLGVEPAALSPAHHVRAQQPPCIIFHGTADTTVPFRTAELFAETMRRHGNRCELIPFEGEGHGFFNAGRPGRGYEETLRAMETFLESLGYLDRTASGPSDDPAAPPPKSSMRRAGGITSRGRAAPSSGNRFVRATRRAERPSPGT